ncbi:hypothetical protein BRD17_02065 [Halobacteriales archaeon SW_7_68_16]|nr:MAG: hypothetical protein BRD17_02065 [Halobacteriales archaeon SW_7_68_16]
MPHRGLHGDAMGNQRRHAGAAAESPESSGQLETHPRTRIHGRRGGRSGSKPLLTNGWPPATIGVLFIVTTADCGMVRVSVVVPTYDDADVVRPTFESLAAQTYDRFEVIVVDDGDDATPEIAREYGFRVVERDTEGIASALNRGIEVADGEFIARQDADDTSDPERLARQVTYMDDHPRVGVLGTGATLVADGRTRGRRRVLERVTHADLLETNHLIHGSVLMRRSAVEAVGGYDDDLDFIEDFDLWARMARETEIHNLDAPLYTFSIHDRSIYATRLREIKLYERYVIGRERDTVPDNVGERVRTGDPEAVYEALDTGDRADFHRELAIELLRYGRPVEARPHARTAAGTAISPVDPALLALSMLPGALTRRVADLYRRVLNRRIRRENRRRTGR